MSETSHVEAAADAPTPRKRLRTRIAVSALIVAGVVNLSLTVFMIPRFAGIFHDMFEDPPLPVVTTLMLNHQWVSVAPSCVWLAAALCAIRNRRAQRHIVAIGVVMGLHAIFTSWALAGPLIRLTHQKFDDLPAAPAQLPSSTPRTDR